MPAWTLIVPLAILAAGALLSRLVSGRRSAARVVAAVAVWAAAAMLLAVWVAIRAPVVTPQSAFDTGAGVRLVLRLDALTAALGLYLLVSVALLLTLVRIPSPALGLLATAASLLTISAGGLLLAALGWGLTLTLIRLMLSQAGAPPTPLSRLRNELAWLLILAAGADVAGRAATEQFGDIPVSAVGAATFAAVATGAAMGSGLVPWQPWTAALWRRATPELGAIAAAVILPLGFDLLLRLYQAGGGHYPGRLGNFALASVGVLVTLGAMLRAQAAATRAGVLSELLPASAGFALLGVGLGTPLGMACGIACLAEAALVTVLAPLLRGAGPRSFTTGLLAAAALPPALGFAVRLLVLQAALEAGEVYGFLALLAGAAWIVQLGATARVMRIAGDAGSLTTSRPGAWFLTGALGLGGALVAALLAYVAVPATSAIVHFDQTALTDLPSAAEMAAGRWPAFAFGFLVAAGAVAVTLATRRWASPPALAPVPLIRPLWSQAAERALATLDGLEMPAEYRVTGWAAFDRGLTSAAIWPWVAATVLLALIAAR